MLTTRERFAADLKITRGRTQHICRLADKCVALNERACNGDPHPRNTDRADKGRNSELWQQELDELDAQLVELLPDGVSLTYTGLRPCLIIGGRYIDIPSAR